LNRQFNIPIPEPSTKRPEIRLCAKWTATVQAALIDLVSCYARTHGPFTAAAVAARLGLGVAPVLSALADLEAQDRVVHGGFLPGQQGQEWCDANVLRQLKRRSLAALRREVEPVEPEALARFLPEWHGINQPRRGLDGILDVVEQLQGAPLPASTLEAEILPARIADYRNADLDELFVQGEVLWRGFDSTGPNDGRIGLYLTDHYLQLAPFSELATDNTTTSVRTLLEQRGALFFDQISTALQQFPNDLLQVLWAMVWNGELTNDTLTPLRSLRQSAANRNRSERRSNRGFRSRRPNRLPGSEGRWTLLPPPGRIHVAVPTTTERQTAIAAQLIERHGVLTKEMLAREQVAGGFAGLYPVLKAMEEAGRVRRGYFVAGLGAAQFASPGAEDRLRDFRTAIDVGQAVVVAATDPANPWGNALAWPATPQHRNTATPQHRNTATPQHPTPNTATPNTATPQHPTPQHRNTQHRNTRHRNTATPDGRNASQGQK
jgi:ATP-dependent Lhr-like helicase